MAFRGIYIKMPVEAVDLLDALAPHIGEVHPARVGRTSVILAMMTDPKWRKRINGDAEVEEVADRLADLLDRSRL